MQARRLGLVDTADGTSDAGVDRKAPTLKVAIATNDLRYLDAHFGSAKHFAMFDVGADGWRFVEVVAFDDVTGEAGRHPETEDRITPKVEALTGAALLFVLAIGGPAAAKVVRAGIHPIKVKEPEPLGAIVLRVQKMLKGKPPPWLRKVLGRPRATRDFVDDAQEAPDTELAR
ncbi:MAG: nitrogen fixation protein NifX [Pseudomonadota bacterium]